MIVQKKSVTWSLFGARLRSFSCSDSRYAVGRGQQVLSNPRMEETARFRQIHYGRGI